MPTEFTRMRSPVDGSEAEVPTDVAEVYETRGWTPVSGSRSYEQGLQELADAQSAAIAATEAKAAAKAAKATAKAAPKKTTAAGGQPGETTEKE